MSANCDGAGAGTRQIEVSPVTLYRWLSPLVRMAHGAPASVQPTWRKQPPHKLAAQTALGTNWAMPAAAGSGRPGGWACASCRHSSYGTRCHSESTRAGPRCGAWWRGLVAARTFNGAGGSRFRFLRRLYFGGIFWHERVGGRAGWRCGGGVHVNT